MFEGTWRNFSMAFPDVSQFVELQREMGCFARIGPNLKIESMAPPPEKSFKTTEKNFKRI